MVIDSFYKLDKALKQSFTDIRKDVIELNRKIETLSGSKLETEAFNKEVSKINNNLNEIKTYKKKNDFTVSKINKNSKKYNKFGNDIDDIISELNDIDNKTAKKQELETEVKKLNKTIKEFEKNTIVKKEFNQLEIDLVVIKNELTKKKLDKKLLDIKDNDTRISVLEKELNSEKKKNEKLEKSLMDLTNIVDELKSNIKLSKEAVELEKDIETLAFKFDDMESKYLTYDKFTSFKDEEKKKLMKLQDYVNDLKKSTAKTKDLEQISKKIKKYDSDIPIAKKPFYKQVKKEEITQKKSITKTAVEGIVSFFVEEVKEEKETFIKPKNKENKQMLINKEEKKKKEGFFSKIKDFFSEEEFEEV